MMTRGVIKRLLVVSGLASIPLLLATSAALPLHAAPPSQPESFQVVFQDPTPMPAPFPPDDDMPPPEPGEPDDEPMPPPFPSVACLLVIGAVVGIPVILWGISRAKKPARERTAPPPARPQAPRQTAESPPARSPTARPRLAGPFADIERQVEVLRRQVADGLLTEDECKARMRELMVEDSDGNWWMVGYETGEWYRHDGTDWIQANPPLAHSDE